MWPKWTQKSMGNHGDGHRPAPVSLSDGPGRLQEAISRPRARDSPTPSAKTAPGGRRGPDSRHLRHRFPRSPACPFAWGLIVPGGRLSRAEGGHPATEGRQTRGSRFPGRLRPDRHTGPGRGPAARATWRADRNRLNAGDGGRRAGDCAAGRSADDGTPRGIAAGATM